MQTENKTKIGERNRLGVCSVNSIFSQLKLPLAHDLRSSIIIKTEEEKRNEGKKIYQR